MFRAQQIQFFTAAFLALASCSAHSLPYSQLVVIGDSLADSGNYAADSPDRTPTPTEEGFIPDHPYEVSRRFSNGPVWVEQFAEKLGLSAVASRLGGTNFAFGAAFSGPGGLGFPFSLTDQVGMYLDAAHGAADVNALHIVVGGGNDLLSVFDPRVFADPVAIIDSYVKSIASILTRLSNAGAQHILLLNVPNVGVTPAFRADALASDLASGIAMAMNDGARAVIGDLTSTLAVDVKIFDLYALVTDAINNPEVYGFTDVISTCASSAACIANPDTTLFWDGIHPTTAGHARLAQAVFVATISEPSSFLLLIVGFGLLRRRITPRGRA